jgi:uncharacterized repeat protein (TIGR03803 family)
VFRVNADGTGFTTLHSFAATTGTNPYRNSEGAYPNGLILLGNTLYGTAGQGGTSGNGTVFRVCVDGMGFTNLHTFAAYNNVTNNGVVYISHSEGAYPNDSLILLGNTLYGTTDAGGSGDSSLHGCGTMFAVNTDGAGFTNLYSFFGGTSDGGHPYGGLILSGNTLYGTTSDGTVFELNTDGTGVTTLHSFSGSDGAVPFAGVILAGSTLYGTTYYGGSTYGSSTGRGTVFAVNTDGTGFATLHSFTAGSGLPPYVNNSDGAWPVAGLILSGSTLYGTASGGGSSGNGTIFSISLPPQLTIIPLPPNVVLTWPTNAAGFTLQSTTNLVSPEVWTTVSPGPVVVNGQNAVTNPISATQQFYRLSQ